MMSLHRTRNVYLFFFFYSNGNFFACHLIALILGLYIMYQRSDTPFNTVNITASSERYEPKREESLAAGKTTFFTLI